MRAHDALPFEDNCGWKSGTGIVRAEIALDRHRLPTHPSDREGQPAGFLRMRHTGGHALEKRCEPVSQDAQLLHYSHI
jgi:hypothetical protein